MYYKPEEWDPLDPEAIEWCEEHLPGALGLLNGNVCHAWTIHYRRGLDKLTPDEREKDPNDGLCWVLMHRAMGVYETIQTVALRMGREDIMQKVIAWAKYSVFY